jgi:MFS family permease
VSNSGNWLTMIAMTLLVLHRTGSGSAVGWLTACQFGPILVLSSWGGVVADRSDKRRFLFVTQSLEMCQSVGLAALVFLHAPTGAFYLVAVVGGVLLAFDNPLRRSFVTEMVSPEDIPNAVTLYSALVNTSRIFGPTIAGALVVTLGYGWCFAIDAASYLVVLAALAAMRPEELRRTSPAPRSRGQVRAGIRYVREVPELWISFTMLAVIGTLSYNFSVVFPLFVIKGLGGSDGTYTAVYSVFSVGSLLGALAVARRGTVRLGHIVGGAGVFGVSLLVLAASPGIAVVFPVVLLVGVCSISYVTATTAIVQVRAEPSMHGRVLALQTVLLVGTTPVGGPLLGAIADRLGDRAPLVVGGVAALVAAAGGWASTAAVRGRSTSRGRTSVGSG